MTRKPTKRQGPTKRPNGSKPTPDGARGVPSAQAGARRLPPLDPDDAKVATELAGLGCSDPAVARYCGLEPETLQRHLWSDPEFRRSYLKRRQSFQLRCLRAMMSALDHPTGGWRCAAWLLERSNPIDFGRVRGPSDEDVHQLIDTLADATMRRVRNEKARTALLDELAIIAAQWQERVRERQTAS
jgi:hypothetical protein